MTQEEDEMEKVLAADFDVFARKIVDAEDPLITDAMQKVLEADIALYARKIVGVILKDKI